MAILINRTLNEGASTAAFEVVATAGGDADTVVDVSALSGAAGSGRERVRVKAIRALVCGDTSAGEVSLDLAWADGPVFLTIPHGVTDMSISCSPPEGCSGDITFASNGARFTLRLMVEKTNGFPLSTSNITSLSL
jgi:hypothetical protein